MLSPFIFDNVGQTFSETVIHSGRYTSIWSTLSVSSVLCDRVDRFLEEDGGLVLEEEKQKETRHRWRFLLSHLVYELGLVVVKNKTPNNIGFRDKNINGVFDRP